MLFYGVSLQGEGGRLCQNEILVAPGRIFNKGESFPFTISMPKEVEDYHGLFWYVEAKLDIPGEIDITKEALIEIKRK